VPTFPESRYQSLRKFDRELEEQYGLVIGCDEVGMAPMAGPALACALLLKPFPEDNIDVLDEVDDVKVLTPDQRLAAYEQVLPRIQECFLAWIWPTEIDQIGIQHAGDRIREKAILGLHSLALKGNRGVVVVDGNRSVPLPEGLGFKSLAVVKADTKSLTVASASVVAKVNRDRLMVELGRAYPDYCWGVNKGYPTRDHLKALRVLGPTPYHRRSFEPVRLAAREGRRDVRLATSLRRRPVRKASRTGQESMETALE
jgi:ribonuclease HII